MCSLVSPLSEEGSIIPLPKSNPLFYPGTNLSLPLKALVRTQSECKGRSVIEGEREREKCIFHLTSSHLAPEWIKCGSHSPLKSRPVISKYRERPLNSQSSKLTGRKDQDSHTKNERTRVICLSCGLSPSLFLSLPTLPLHSIHHHLSSLKY